jgi:hypothetical protein
VRKGTTLSGTATDNIGVERIEFIERSTGKVLAPVTRDGDNWFIELSFDIEDNGKKIIGEIRAYDKMGNSSERSFVSVTMIIDILPPLVDGITIQRTNTRISYLEPLSALLELETTDRLGEKKDNVYKYQNGWFYITCKVNDEETKVKNVKLGFYDICDLTSENPLLEKAPDAGSTNYFPKWTIKEEDIINAGQAKFGGDYETKYYVDKERYYYRVVIEAYDEILNKSIEEDEGYLCLWAKSDEPKGILDPAIGTMPSDPATGTSLTGTEVSRGTPLPIDFFDDDSLSWAYAGLFTKDQWLGKADISASGPRIPQNGTDKLVWLKDQLRGGVTIYNWLYDKHSTLPDKTNEPITELIKSKKLDEQLVYVSTGKGEYDFGDYVLFTLAADDKSAPPHNLTDTTIYDVTGTKWTNKNIWWGKTWDVAVIDENVPLIVFDTTKGSPEENTFPQNLQDGEFFTIIGYTLRENKMNLNSVSTFRMAWIPYNMPDLPGKPKGADGYIKDVQDALRKNNFAGMPEGVQYWDFEPTPGKPPASPDPGKFYDEGNEEIDTGVYRRQSFRKTFSVLGGADDINTATKNFTYNNKLENETKLFIFYALDTMGHEVFRQLRLLGNKTPPNLTVYDFSNHVDSTKLSGLPDPNNAIYNDPTTGFNQATYYTALNTYNRNGTSYTTIKDVIGHIPGGKPEDKIPSLKDVTIPFQIYPRGTTVKYYIYADKSGATSTAVEKITMKDITFSGTGQDVGSLYNSTNQDLTFCEYYPDVTQRTFLFEATDKLGNVARIQRTIAVTNAAKLESITTTSQSGTYGIGKKIILQANFSSQVYITGAAPKLNIRYWSSANAPIYAQIPCTNSPLPTSSANSTTILEFEFIVPAGTGGTGIIETLYNDADITINPPGFNPPASSSPDYDKCPIILPTGTQIMDSSRNDSAFIPGYTFGSISMPNWTTDKGSLQERKSIRLDGVRPKIISPVAVSGKDKYSDGNYYFKNGETLEFTLNADKDIRAIGTPILNYSLLNKAGGNVEVNNTSKFKYQRPGTGQRALVFSLPVSDVASADSDGRFSVFNLPAPTTTGDTVTLGIVDNADNSVDTTTGQNLQNLITPAATIYIKKSIPQAPLVTLTGPAPTVIGSTTYYNSNPRLTVQASQSTTFPEWEDLIQYSLDGGLSWVTYPTAKAGWTNVDSGNLYIGGGTWDLWVRYIDRAGNEGTPRKQKIQINDKFPQLVGINAVQPNSTYKQGDTLDFTLEFADQVRTTNVANVTITISNRSSSPNTTTGVMTLEATAQNPDYSTVIKFKWAPLIDKEMLDGLYVSAITLTGLQDRFGNVGKNSTGATYTTGTTGGTVVFDSYTFNKNLVSGLIVDCIAPSITGRTPAIDGVSTDNKTITLTFSEPVMIGTGKITIRPHGTYKIPAVFENNGSTVTGLSKNGSATEGTYVAGFYDVYNSVSNADKQTLTLSSDATNPSMGKLALDTRSGQSAGPYIKLTQGLKEGPGFTGSYTGASANDPSIGGTFMVPDTATKWVLDYRYSIDNANNTQFGNTTYTSATNTYALETPPTATVNNIRAVLTRAHWRWQEMELVSSVKLSNSDKTVTITLNEPLLVGLQWGLSFPEGAFTDKAGNKAAAVGSYNTDGTVNTANNSPYYFWSNGVQAPVIRVNRKSYDARTRNWSSTTRAYAAPENKGDGTAANSVPGGWGIGDFNYVHFRIESETPGATLTYAKETGSATGTTRGSITAAWTGVIANNRGWDYPQSNNNTNNTNATDGDWVLPNLVRRTGGGTNGYYEVTENGFTTRRSITGSYSGYRSYNRDATKATLDGLTLNNFTGFQDSFTYDKLQASKNYVVARASITNGGTTYNSDRSYEGVFRSVIAMKQDGFGGNLNGANRDNNPIMVQGSNVKNGMPSISGFPVYDAGESGDNRFVKYFYYDETAGTNTNLTRAYIYWVSTEIVSQWYFLGFGGTHWTTGDVNNYLFAGYGDLCFIRNGR